jgi:PTH1 family peptidyl-tRNA hydrolase
MPLELAAFLGNPGEVYARNRHNAGRLAAEKLSFYAALNWRNKFKGCYAEQDIPPQARFIMPETYMNRSGEAVAAAAAFFKIQAGDIIVVHDELELHLGTVSLKFGGGLGGHNGLRSLRETLGTADFWRLRIGIGRPGDREPGRGGGPEHHGDIALWVLQDFSAAEQPLLDQSLEAAAGLLVEAFRREPAGLLPEWAKKRCLPA